MKREKTGIAQWVCAWRTPAPRSSTTAMHKIGRAACTLLSRAAPFHKGLSLCRRSASNVPPSKGGNFQRLSELNTTELLRFMETDGHRADGRRIVEWWSSMVKADRSERTQLLRRGKLDKPCKVLERGLPLLQGPIGLARTAYALGKLRVGDRPPWTAVWSALADRSAATIRDFNGQSISNTTWAFATAGHASPALFDAVAAEATKRGLREFNPQALANTAWAFATAGHASPALLDAVAAEATKRGLREFTPQALANTAWAFATADHPAQKLFDSAFVVRSESIDWTLEALIQLQQWQLWHAEHGLAPPLSASLAARCRSALASTEVRPSRLQRDVGRALEALGCPVQEEVVTESGYSIDLVVEYDGTRVGVEVDGPSHFICRSPTASTLLKRRQLRSVGWSLLSVPYFEWSPLRSKHDKCEYLQASLKATLDAPLRVGESSGLAYIASQSADELRGLTVPVLKQRLRDAGLPVSGRKEELIVRLLDGGGV